MLTTLLIMTMMKNTAMLYDCDMYCNREAVGCCWRYSWTTYQKSTVGAAMCSVLKDALMRSDAAPQHGALDYTQSSSLAELACRWAEQRRRALEVRALVQYSSLTANITSAVTPPTSPTSPCNYWQVSVICVTYSFAMSIKLYDRF